MQPATQEKWRTIIASQQASALSVNAFCKQHHISTSAFYQRKRELRAQSQRDHHFVKATVTETLDLTSHASTILISTGNVNIHLPADTSPEFLAQLLKGLQS